MHKMRLLVLGDHPVVRRGMVESLAQTDRMEVVGEAKSLGEALIMAYELEPEVVVIDLHLRDGQGYEAGHLVKRLMPNVKVFLFGDMLAESGNGVYSGEVLHDSRTATIGQDGDRDGPETLSGKRRLTRAEQRVAWLVVKGYRNKAIAESLFISVNTVKAHMQSIFRKFNVRNRSELVGLLLSQPSLLEPGASQLDLSSTWGS